VGYKYILLFIILLITSASNGYQHGAYTVLIDKSEHELYVIRNGYPFKIYHVVFGSDDLSDKMFEGDRRTPDGTFKVSYKKMSKDWGPELMLDYPTEESFERFNKRKQEGTIPNNAKIGCCIAIHGTIPSSNDKLIDSNINWTNGCISLKLNEMHMLYKLIQVNTTVTIRQ
jgi:murein L,D-transpeptidase YafK